jgi:2-polyprenyl-3-methyl-5-hydroxy-6-metoxy-1,4-benzoquinol methylase
VRSLCDYLTVQELLTKEAGRYALTQETALFLDRRSPACIASMAEFMVSEFNKRTFSALADAVRKGGTTSGEGDNTKPKDEMWVTFARSMVPLAIPAAEFIAQLTGAAQGKECSVLDIAAGHGMYGITLARRNPKAKIVALDWPNVLEVARENAKKFGVAERYSTRAGSAFEAELGEGYDFVLLTNIFHHFDKPTCEKLMRRVHAALKPGGRAITVEFVPNEDRVSPPVAAGFSLIMLAGTDAGDAYTLSEYEKMFGNAGFAKTTLHQAPDMPQQVLVTEKAE